MTGDIVDRIDELVDAQLEQEASGYDHNLAQAQCWHCGREWHGLAITARLEKMRQLHALRMMLAELCGVLDEELMHRPAVDPDYRYADDDSEILCPGSAFIGPRTPTRFEHALTGERSMHDWIQRMIGEHLSVAFARPLLGLDESPYSYQLPTIAPGDRIGGDGVVHVHEATPSDVRDIRDAVRGSMRVAPAGRGFTIDRSHLDEVVDFDMSGWFDVGRLAEFAPAVNDAPYVWGGDGSVTARAPPRLPAALCPSVFRVRMSVPFFQVDDQLATNRKPRSLAERALEGHMDGVAALGLWLLAGSDCQAEGSDGVVKRANAVRILLNASMADQLAALLVDVGLWHAPGHSCDRCPAVADGTWLFHDWFDLGYDRATKVRETRRKRRELKDRELIARVWARDCIDPADPTVGRCRYCAAELRRKDTRSDNRPTLDHVDPNLAAGVRNVVLACGSCNRRKGNRTPQEAGMTLLPPPRPDAPSTQEPPPRTAAGLTPQPRNAAGPSRPGSSRTDDPAVRTLRAAPAASDAAGPPSTPTGSDRPPAPGTSPRHAAGPSGPAGHATPPPPVADHPPDHSDTTTRPPADQFGDHGGRGVPARVRGDARARAGSGLGEGWGVGKGVPTGSPDSNTPTPDKNSRRRRPRARSRSRRQQGPPTQPPADNSPMDAGAAPHVEVAGRFGSPYFGWTGPPDTTGDETTCPAHGLPEPCWKCQDQLREGQDDSL